jgi:LysR family transcriptional regulator, transcriptional activator of nhaA
MDTSVFPKQPPFMEWLNYHHLRYFWTVAREGSLAAAAARLRVSQPSISEQIKELEQSLGEPLFQRQGRANKLTEAGQVACRYAEEIFALGGEMINAVKNRPGARSLRFYVGIVDSFPKLVTSDLLAPAFAMPQPVHVICREGKMSDLLAQLAAHRLDMVLSDEPASSSAGFKVFSHLLGETGTTFLGEKRLAARLRRGFPKSLDLAPALLPAENTRLRRSLEIWFREQNLRPKVVAEFDDLALMKVMAAEGRGFIAVPSLAASDAAEHYRFHKIGATSQCRAQFHAITAERRVAHPAAALIVARRVGTDESPPLKRHRPGAPLP